MPNLNADDLIDEAMGINSRFLNDFAREYPDAPWIGELMDELNALPEIDRGYNPLVHWIRKNYISIEWFPRRDDGTSHPAFQLDVKTQVDRVEFFEARSPRSSLVRTKMWRIGKGDPSDITDYIRTRLREL